MKTRKNTHTNIYSTKKNTKKHTKKNTKKHTKSKNYKLLKALTKLHTPTGEEERGVEFLLNYINTNKSSWKHTPKIIHNEDTKNNIIMVFGNPNVAILSHLDSIGFTYTGNKNKLIDIGGVMYTPNAPLRGYNNSNKPIFTTLKIKNNKPYTADKLEIGTNLTFVPKWNETDKYIKSTNLDNKLGVFLCLQLAETIENGIIILTCGEEEPMSDDIPYLTKFIYENYNVKNVVIMDVTETVDNIKLGKGTVITYRDENIYKRAFVNKIIKILNNHTIQLEVINVGSSDGAGVMSSPYPMNVVFMGIPIKNLHSNKEIVNKKDIGYTLKNIKTVVNKL